MTIAKGRPWGVPGALPPGGLLVRTDAEAGAAVTAARRAGAPAPVLGLLGGDLYRTLGGAGDEARLRSGAAMTFPVDLGTILVDGEPAAFVAHAFARNRSWTRVVLVLNAQWMGTWNVGPRAHPNDGLIDTYEARLRLGDLGKVRARLDQGVHLPHPRIKERRTSGAIFELDPPLALWVDGERWPRHRVRRLECGIEPDALRVVV